MPNARPKSAQPAGLAKNGDRKSSLTSENTATNANGITLTTWADNFACAVWTLSERRSASSPSTESRAASSTCLMLPPVWCCTSRATATNASSEAPEPCRSPPSASVALPPVSSTWAPCANRLRRGPSASLATWASVCCSERPASKHVPIDRSTSGTASRTESRRRSAAARASPAAPANAQATMATAPTALPVAAKATAPSTTHAATMQESSARSVVT